MRTRHGAFTTKSFNLSIASCSSSPQCHGSPFTSNRFIGLAIFEKCLIQILTTAHVPKKPLTSVVVLGTGQRAIFSTLRSSGRRPS